MQDERPPIIDAEFKVVRGPRPRWAVHSSLMKLALRTALAVALCILVALGIVLLMAD